MFAQEEEIVNHQKIVTVPQVTQEINVNLIFALERIQLILWFVQEEVHVHLLNFAIVTMDSLEINVK
jgi:hypothetical protein